VNTLKQLNPKVGDTVHYTSYYTGISEEYEVVGVVGDKFTLKHDNYVFECPPNSVEHHLWSLVKAPVRKVRTFTGGWYQGTEAPPSFYKDRAAADTHLLTYTTVEGVIDCASVKLEKL